MDTKQVPDHTYPLAYKITPLQTPLTKTQLTQQDLGGCDAIIIHSILNQPNGTRNELIISHNGHTNQPLTDQELFKSLAVLAYQLSQSTTLPQRHRDLANDLHQAIKRDITQHRNK